MSPSLRLFLPPSLLLLLLLVVLGTSTTVARPIPCASSRDSDILGYTDWDALRRALHERQERVVTICPGAVLTVDDPILLNMSHVLIRCGEASTTETTTADATHDTPPCTIRGGISSHFLVTSNVGSNMTNVATNITLQGLTFERAGLSSIRIVQAGDLTFSDCTWQDNVVPVTTPGGTTLEIVAAHNVTVQRCTFHNNG